MRHQCNRRTRAARGCGSGGLITFERGCLRWRLTGLPWGEGDSFASKPAPTFLCAMSVGKSCGWSPGRSPIIDLIPIDPSLFTKSHQLENAYNRILLNFSL